ncbi:MAG: UvrD-helicase domain-containing protein [Candidatus Sericytochromatia bacterium]|nr:UvrD-helicase domain-containing protein [Candidatus Sericytochromatia bacterium]
MGIEIISASAGTGKTWTLAQRIEEAIRLGRARPECIVATTYSVKAAAELRQRVRERLLEAGLVQEAQRLSAARIGTVHSVCRGLLQDFNFEVGLSPELRVLDENSAKVEIRRAQSRVLTPQILDKAADLASRMQDWQLDEPVREVVDFARSNGISTADLADSKRKSLDTLNSMVLPAPIGTAGDLLAALKTASASFQAMVLPMTGLSKVSTNAISAAAQLNARLARGEQLLWRDWYKLASQDTGRDIAAHYQPLRDAASAQDAHPLLREDCEEAIKLVFQVAGLVMDAYATHKQELGLVDFIDQEMLALDLLNEPQAGARLSDELDLLLVDEFQDTSPLQLAIFLKLADLAKESIWVGDKKQSIYGFRGADPEMLDAVIHQLGARNAVSYLDTSWRSLPELVQQTSDMFEKGLAGDGYTAQEVRLTPAPATIPAGGRPIVESWRLNSKNQADALKDLATGIFDMLAASAAGGATSLQIRDRVSGNFRDLRAGDIAVLCNLNDSCAALAEALAKVGVPARVARKGLMGTHEASLIRAGLALWADPKDKLAAAEIGRLTEGAGDSSLWLQRLLDDESPFEALVAPLVKAREDNPVAGPLTAFDLVCETLEVREWCLRWGDSSNRLANVERLRAHAVAMTEQIGDGTARTPAALLVGFQKLADAEGDSQGTGGWIEAVDISTWHRSKGLEWPVVILAHWGSPNPRVFGVSVSGDGGSIDLTTPLAGRWIRYWPYPYASTQTTTPFADRATRSPIGVAVREADERELRRLAYVGWTRARDRVIVAAVSPRGATSPCKYGCLDPLPGGLTDNGPTLSVAGLPVPIPHQHIASRPLVAIAAVPMAAPTPSGRRAHHPAFTNPSRLAGTGSIGTTQTIGPRILLQGRPDFEILGQAIHGFLAADRPTWDPARRLAVAKRVLDRWLVAGFVTPQALVDASDALHRWVGANWPDAEWHREWPITMPMADGSILRGTCDLALETTKGWIVIDHKSYPGSEAQAAERAKEHAPQLEAYGAALAMATGKPFLGGWVHMAVGGVVFGLGQPVTEVYSTALHETASAQTSTNS